jgi:hypothetical protein
MMIAAAEPELRREMLAVNMKASIAVFWAIVNPPVGKLGLHVGKAVETHLPITDKGFLCG